MLKHSRIVALVGIAAAVSLVMVMVGACNLFVDSELAESVDDDLVSDIPSDGTEGIEDLTADEGIESDWSGADGRSSEDATDLLADQDPCSACGERQCGELGGCPSCGDCTGCESECVGNMCLAASQAETVCRDGDIWWVDSCGNWEGSAPRDECTTACSEGDSFCPGDPCAVCGSRECGAFGECPSCGDCTSCESQCSGNSCSAILQDHQDCSGADPYWYDSCGNRGSRADTCEACESCVDAGSTAACSPTANDHKDCEGGHSYWYDSCDVRGSRVETCEECEVCVNLFGAVSCIPASDHQACYGGHPYWYDSCGDRGSRVETCESHEPCVNSGETASCVTVPDGFVYIPPGTFCMGSPGGGGSAACPDSTAEPERDTDEGPLHEVTLTRGFFLQETEVTQRQWTALGFVNSSRFDECGLDCPVDSVNWWEAVAYVNALSVSKGLEPCYSLEGCDPSEAGTDIDCSEIAISDSGASDNPYLCEGYRLPMEAEWEYAYRAGTTTAFYNGGITETDCASDPNLDAIGWYCGNASSTTHVVSPLNVVNGKAPNAWGLYDMSGNTGEWVWDWYQYNYYASSPSSDPLGGYNNLRVRRGGAYYFQTQDCRAAVRSAGPPGTSTAAASGLRPARSVP